MNSASNERLDMLHSVKEIAYMLALIGASVALATTGHETLAATALGGAISPVLNRASPVRIPALALALGLGAAVSLTGCAALTPAQGADLAGGIAKVTCYGARKLCTVFGRSDACDAITVVCQGVDAISSSDVPSSGGDASE